MHKYDYGKFINTPVTEPLRKTVKKLAHQLEIPMAEYIRNLILKDLKERNLWPPKRNSPTS